MRTIKSLILSFHLARYFFPSFPETQALVSESKLHSYLLSLEGFDEGGFLSADIGAGAAMQIDVKVVSAAAGVLPDQSSSVCFGDGDLSV